MKISSYYPKMSQSEILSYFNKFDIEVPKEYVNFLVEQNGGYPEFEFEYVDREDDEYRIILSCFYGISNMDTTISLFARRGFLSGSLPSELLSIASDGIGNEICLGIGSEYLGKIYFWNKDGETTYDEEPSFDNVELVTGSFSDFLSSMKKIEY